MLCAKHMGTMTRKRKRSAQNQTEILSPAYLRTPRLLEHHRVAVDLDRIEFAENTLTQKRQLAGIEHNGGHVLDRLLADADPVERHIFAAHVAVGALADDVGHADRGRKPGAA